MDRCCWTYRKKHLEKTYCRRWKKMDMWCFNKQQIIIRRSDLKRTRLVFSSHFYHSRFDWSSFKYIEAILESTRGGRFEVSPPHHWSNALLLDEGPKRAPNWEALAKEQEIVAITCHHLGGDEDTQWKWEYDEGLRGRMTGKMIRIMANKNDMYVFRFPTSLLLQILTWVSIICNGWLARSFPRPEVAADIVLINHRWIDFSWRSWCLMFFSFKDHIQMHFSDSNYSVINVCYTWYYSIWFFKIQVECS